MTSVLRIGTRASPLALAQARMAAASYSALCSEVQVELVSMQTKGDKDGATPLRDWGFKGLFTKELDDALLRGGIDIAVHSMKDMPSELPDGMVIGAVLPRADVRDAWISHRYPSLDALPKGGVVGTSSLRRAAQIRALRPDIRVLEFRGNVQTRLRKLADGVVDATLLACAGLDRLNMAEHIAERLDTTTMLPAVAQGIIAITCRSDDIHTQDVLSQMHHAETAIQATAERAMLRALDGSCRTPIAGLACVHGTQLTLTGALYAEDGSRSICYEKSAAIADAEPLGLDIAHAIKQDAPVGTMG
jgi:hydroxymethylbilane synthase